MHIADLKDHVGKEVELKGWVYRWRESKGIVFLVLRDVTGVVQCVIKGDAKDFKEAQKAKIESSVILKGVVKEDKRGPGGYEIQITKLQLVGQSENFPIKEDASTEFLLDMRHLWVRSRRLTSIFKVRSDVFGAIHEFFRNGGFFEIQSPSITASACEGGSTLFEVKYFDQKAYLTQSWQLYAEAMIASLEKIYCIAPSFRAEKSRTRRHLAEYWHAEAEAAWMDHEANLKLQEELVFFVIQKVLKNREEDLKFLERDIDFLKKIKLPFPRITYTEAVKKLEKDGVAIKWGQDFGIDEEKILTAHFKSPFFVTQYPKAIKAFYMKQDPKDPNLVLNDDMFAPEGYGEIIGGSEREVDVERVIQRLKAQGSSIKDYEWYLDIRKYGSVPHAGFGLGVERLVMWLCGLDHIRDTIAFPRVMNRVYP